MFDLLKKALYAGVGLAFTTAEKAEQAARKLVEEGKLSEGDARRFVEELMRKSGETRGALERMVKDTLDGALARIDIPRRSEFDSLEARVRALENQTPR